MKYININPFLEAESKSIHREQYNLVFANGIFIKSTRSVGSVDDKKYLILVTQSTLVGRY